MFGAVVNDCEKVIGSVTVNCAPTIETLGFEIVQEIFASDWPELGDMGPRRPPPESFVR
jgi:hypothetical protein